MKQQCCYMKVDGARCRGYAVKDSVYCFFHVADGAAARLAGSRGGKKSKAPAVAEDNRGGRVDIHSVHDVITLLEGSIDDVRKGRLSSQTVNSVGYLANILIKALERKESSDRLEAMERNRNLYMGLGVDFPGNGNGNDDDRGDDS